MKNRFAIRLIHAGEVRRQASSAFFALRSLGLICALVCLASAASAQSRYQITRIPTPQGANSAALGLNDKGEVVGYSFQGDDYQAFLYSYADKQMTDVGSLGGKLNAACAISDASQVIGYSQDGNGNLLAFVFSRNAPIASLGTLDGASTSEAFGVNNSGSVVGDSQSGNQNHRPVLFSNGSVQDLGSGASNDPDALETAYAINDSGQIVGRHSAGNNVFHAFLYANGNTTDFGTLGGANGEALAINKKGQVVGDSDTADGPAHAFLFVGSLKDLGTLPGYENASYARGINNSGEIVGESDSADQKRAFLYTKGQLVELDKLVANLSQSGFSSLDVAYGINEKGWIVGYGTTSDNLTAAFIAVPEGAGNQAQGGGVPSGQAVPQPQGQGQPVSESVGDDYSVFYSKLSSEGSWVDAGGYGYCFRPRAATGDWRPYRDGHWVWTDRGWFWDSNEHFGWATYHYGRWVNVAGTGWCWVPGNQWAPAWVSWREGGDYAGWAPLPPEASISVHVGISSWSDSYYGIGPAAYTFIRYSNWSAPSYATYVVPPAQNVQIISQTKNITNITTNNTVINNYGPQVQTVAARTGQNIQQVKLVVNPATGANANYGHTLSGNQLNVVAPPATLKPVAAQAPAVQNRIANPTVEKGWQDVKGADAEKLKKTIAEQNPVPKDLPQPTPLATPQILKKGQVAGLPGAPGSPATVAGQKQTPPNLVKPFTGPGGKSPSAKVTPGAWTNAPVAEKRSIPPNLPGVKPSGGTGAGAKPTPPNLPGSKQSPGGGKPSPTVPGVSKTTPPNLNAPKSSPAPERPKSEENKLFASPTPKSGGGIPPGESPHASATPRVIPTPTTEKKLETTPATTPRHEPANLATPKSIPEVKTTPRQTEKEIKTPAPRPTPERKPEEVHPAATPQKSEGGKEEGKHPKGSATPEKKE